ncbi:MAG: hypothetical protein KME23_03495 [Goleter apudmare HA4340-LM2]|jgi:hypothetical protein|nr:hypothetical protein [Goleter apudmare HA4340-LM2]
MVSLSGNFGDNGYLLALLHNAIATVVLSAIGTETGFILIFSQWSSS